MFHNSHCLARPVPCGERSDRRVAGLVLRRKEGLHAWYRLASQDVFTLCDIMCGSLQRDLAARRNVLADAQSSSS